MCTYFITHPKPILLTTYPEKSLKIFYKIPKYTFNISLV
jgi:hypothetical protein